MNNKNNSESNRQQRKRRRTQHHKKNKRVKRRTNNNNNEEESNKQQFQEEEEEDIKKGKQTNHQHQQDEDDNVDNICWRNVPVELPKPMNNKNGSKNHYDDYDDSNNNSSSRNATAAAAAAEDLDGMPNEEMAIFYGLEVIDGNDYKVQHKDNIKHIVYCNATNNICTSKKNDNNNNDNEKDYKDNNEDTTTTKKSSKKEERKKKRKKQKKNNEATTNENGGVGDSNSEKEKKNNHHHHRHQQQDDQQREEEQEQEGIINKIQSAWTVSSNGVVLSDNICLSLHKQNFTSPTLIQSTTLAPSILGRRNIVGAAPTGSGKTLAYLLPIVQYCIELQEQHSSNNDTTSTESSSSNNNHNNNNYLHALIIAPTRELALQVSKECNKLLLDYNNNNNSSSRKIHCNTIVGGISIHKQQRLLKKKPHIIVATPGRLWDLMSSGEYKHISNLRQLKFLVIDEADRMINQNSFPQLTRILDTIHYCNPMTNDDEESIDGNNNDYGQGDESDNDNDDNNDDHHRLLGLPGLPGEAKVQMLSDDILKMMNKNNNDDDNESDDDEDNDDKPDPVELDDDEYERLLQDQQQEELVEMDEAFTAAGSSNLEEDDDDDDDDTSLPPVQRQTFVYSATLTLPPSSLSTPSKSKYVTNNKEVVDGAIGEILQRAHVVGPTKIVDLTTKNLHNNNNTTTNSKNKKQKNSTTSNEITTTSTSSSSIQRLPPGLTLEEIKCTQRHKDSHLYAYLLTSHKGKEGGALSRGPCLIFCNSIASVKRVGVTLQTLNLNVRMLHANMVQKARFKAVESLRKPNSKSIVVATDVAARGLDIPSVATVVHYDVARQVDTFIHRAGRTARGVGDGAVGCSLSLVASAEDKSHDKICEALARSNSDNSSTTTVSNKMKRLIFNSVVMDGRLLSASQERVSLATKIVACNDEETKTHKKNQWFVKAAEDAGLDLDDDLLEDGLVNGNEHERQQLRQAQQAREKLRSLLSVPMQTQRYQKFLKPKDIIAASID